MLEEEKVLKRSLDLSKLNSIEAANLLAQMEGSIPIQPEFLKISDRQREASQAPVTVQSPNISA